MRGVLVPVGLLVVALSGCVIGTQPEPEVVYVTQTVTAAPPTPPTFLKVATVQNSAGNNYEVRFQAYRLSNSGEQVTTAYAMRSILVKPGANTVSADGYPSCDDKMEGLQIRLWSIGGTTRELTSGYWPGVHCTGDAKAYSLAIDSESAMRFG